MFDSLLSPKFIPTAREKASQVLRDALGLQIAIPTSALSNKSNSGSNKHKTQEASPTAGFVMSPIENRRRQGMPSALVQMRRDSPERVQSGVAVPPSWGGGAGVGRCESGGVSISSLSGFPSLSWVPPPPPPAAAAAVGPPYLPVTPSLSVSKRKRHRALETPDAFKNVYNATFASMNTSPASNMAGYTPPMPPPGPPSQPPSGYQYPTQRPYVGFPSQHPPTNGANATGRVTDSFNRAGGRSSSSVYPYSAYPGRNSLSSGFLDDVPGPPPPHDFDLFNGELLSDQSDRDGAISPAAYYPYSRQNQDRRESL